MVRIIIISIVSILLLGMSAAHAQSSGPKAELAVPIKDELDQIRKDARNDFEKTAEALRALEGRSMNAEDRATWVRLSREAAVRNGDLATLSALKDKADPFSLLPLSRILLANAYLNEGRLSEARAELGRLGPLDRINTRDQRRTWALKARIAQLEGKPVEERDALEHIVHELSHWASADCQGCHNDLKNPQAIPLLEVQNTWYAKRYVELLQQTGTVDKIRTQAEKKLSKDPEDKDARIHLGFALLAQGKALEAEQSWREIPWIALSERTGASPRMLFAWP